MKRWIIIGTAIAIASFAIGYHVSTNPKLLETISSSGFYIESVRDSGSSSLGFIKNDNSGTIASDKDNHENKKHAVITTVDTGMAYTSENDSDSSNTLASKQDLAADKAIDSGSDAELNDGTLPGHNTYDNGFKRLTKLTYDDVATVTDSTYSFTIGTYYDENYYKETVESYSDFGSGILANGCYCRYYNILYKDIEIAYTNYNPIICDYSAKHEYWGEIRLITPRFKTQSGLHVGSSVQDVFDAYPKDIDKTPSEEGGDPCYELYIDGVLTKFFFDEDTQKITSIKLSY